MKMNRFFRQVSAVIKQTIAREPNNGDTFLSVLSPLVVSSEALGRQSRNSSILSALSTCSEAPPAVERKRVKLEPKENF